MTGTFRVRVDSSRCVGHGRCYEIAPEVFEDDERGHCVLRVERVPESDVDAARRAEANCPEQAISVTAEPE